MAIARVVTFEGVSKDRMEEMNREMSEGEQPEGFPATEVVALHDPETEKSLVILFFETEDDYKTGDEMLNAMPAGETPGRRTSVTKYDVATRMTT
jgi:heme-degrading monooxygenase HmoA